MDFKKFEEEFIFTKYKDQRVVSASVFKNRIIPKEYRNSGLDLGKLYVRIVNYQVKKYGKNLYR